MKAAHGMTLIARCLLIIAAVSTLTSCGDSGKSSDSSLPGNQIRLWVCLAQDEPHDFKMTVSEEAKANGVVCPVCDSTYVFRAAACPSCGRYYPVGRYNASPTTCMHCGAELPGKDVSTLHSHGGH
ncbi:MAG: hypothetical protein KDA31_03460 [Phycisphaerales bacterium]|nr:hypothetical protein [Phycisphaerales bacterium]MCB9835324.1 hypothetical protein [Phycisphaera sp.]